LFFADVKSSFCRGLRVAALLTVAIGCIEFAPLGPETSRVFALFVANITIRGGVGRYLDLSPTGVEVKIEPN
jgi:hypothetical protein